MHVTHHRAGGTGRAGRETGRPIFRRILVLFILYATTTPQNSKIHTAHVGVEINPMNINKIVRLMLFRYRRPCITCSNVATKLIDSGARGEIL